MTSPKSVSWSALVNIGNNESIALTVSGEAANPDEARDIFAFACGQLLGVANSADEDTAPLIRAYVSRLVQTEEARPVVQEAPAPAPKKEPWEPKITKPSYDKVPDVGAPTPIPPPATPAKASTPATFDRASPPPNQMPAPPVADAVSRQQHADKLMADLNRLQADHNARVAVSKVPTPAEQAAAAVAQCIKPPAAPPKPEASAPSAPPEGFGICAECGEAVPSNQAKLSNMFMNKTLCKKCMDSPGGSA